MIDSIHWKYFLIIILFAVLGIVFTIVSGSRERQEQKRLISLIAKEFNSHPKMKAQDLYKFLHQAAMGSEHAVKNPQAAKDWMKNEIASMDSTIENNLVDTLSYGSIVRVNLRPYLKAGFSADKLVEAFIKTANNYKGSKETLKDYLAIAKRMIRRKDINIDYAEFNSLVNEMETKGFPALHHSKEYEEAYKPAYRVIALEYLPELLKK